jgi:hypothetical protein
MKPLCRYFAALFAACILAAASQAGPYDQLLKFVPEAANVIALIDVVGLHNSPLGKQEGWARKHQNDYLGGAIRISPKAKMAIIASQLNDGLQPNWEVEVIELQAAARKDGMMARLAEREGSTVETIAGQQAVWSPRNAFFVDLGPGLYGVMAPANRQELGRWVRSIKRNPSVTILPYLEKAFAKPLEGAQIVLAVDALDMVDPTVAQRYLSQSKAVGDRKGAELDKLVRALTSLQGIKFTVKVGDGISGELRLDFESSVEAYAGQLMPLILELLAEWGAMIDGIENWKLQAAGTSATLTGTLPAAGIRQVLSVIQPPAPNLDLDEPAAAQKPGVKPAIDPRALATQQYFQAINTLLNDLRERSRQTSNFQLAANWYRTYAQQIDSLPMTNVDPEMLNFGVDTATRLRAISQSLNGVAVDTRLLAGLRSQATLATPRHAHWGGGWGWGGGGWGGWHQAPSVYRFNNFHEVNAAKAQVARAGQQDRLEIWNQIDAERSAIRRTMFDRHKIEF